MNPQDYNDEFFLDNPYTRQEKENEKNEAKASNKMPSMPSIHYAGNGKYILLDENGDFIEENVSPRFLAALLGKNGKVYMSEVIYEIVKIEENYFHLPKAQLVPPKNNK